MNLTVFSSEEGRIHFLTIKRGDETKGYSVVFFDVYKIPAQLLQYVNSPLGAAYSLTGQSRAAIAKNLSFERLSNHCNEIQCGRGGGGEIITKQKKNILLVPVHCDL